MSSVCWECSWNLHAYKAGGSGQKEVMRADPSGKWLSQCVDSGFEDFQPQLLCQSLRLSYDNLNSTKLFHTQKRVMIWEVWDSYFLSISQRPCVCAGSPASEGTLSRGSCSQRRRDRGRCRREWAASLAGGALSTLPLNWTCCHSQV